MTDSLVSRDNGDTATALYSQFLFWRRDLVDEQIGQRMGLEGQRIGVVHGTLVHHDLGADLEAGDGLGIGGNKRRTAEWAPSGPRRRLVHLIAPDRAEIFHSEAIALPLWIAHGHWFGRVAFSTVFLESEPLRPLLNG